MSVLSHGKLVLQHNRSEIEKYKGQGLNTDNQRKKILKDLEDRLAKTEVLSAEFMSL